MVSAAAGDSGILGTYRNNRADKKELGQAFFKNQQNN